MPTTVEDSWPTATACRSFHWAERCPACSPVLAEASMLADTNDHVLVVVSDSPAATNGLDTVVQRGTPSITRTVGG